MRLSILTILFLAALASPGLAQQRASVGASVRIVSTLGIAAPALADTLLRVETGTARLRLPVKAGWSWLMVAQAGGTPVPLEVRICGSGRCVRADHGGAADPFASTLVVDYRDPGASASTGTLTYIIAPL